MTDTKFVFRYRGGTFISSRRTSPRATAWSASQIRSMWMPPTSAPGSTSGHAAVTKVRRFRRGRSAASSLGEGSTAGELLQGGKLGVRQPSEVEHGVLGLDRAAVLSNQLGLVMCAPPGRVAAFQVGHGSPPVLAHRAAKDGHRIHLGLGLGTN